MHGNTSLLVLSLIDSAQLTVAIGAITTLFIELSAAMGIISKFGKGTGLVKVTSSMVLLSSALLVLSVALKILSTIPLDKMGVALIGLSVGLGLLVGAVNLLPDKKLKDAAKAIKKMSTALLILAVAMKIMSTMSWQEMGVGLITTAVSLGLLVGAVNLLPGEKVNSAASAIKKCLLLCLYCLSH